MRIVLKWCYNSPVNNANKGFIMKTLHAIFSNVHKGAIFFGFDTVTMPVLTGGKKNPMQGRIKKIMTGAQAMANANYEKGRNKQLIAAGFKPTFKTQARRWGKYAFAGLPIVEHKGAAYLVTSILKAGKVSYLLDDKPIDAADITGLKESKGTNIDEKEVARQLAEMTDEQRLVVAANAYSIEAAMSNPDSIDVSVEILAAARDNTKPLFPRDFKAESITTLRISGKAHTGIVATVS